MRLPRIHYAWLVAAAGFVTLITSAGFRSTAGVLIVPLQDEFGWSRATLGFAVSINLVLFGLGAPFAAALMERFGLRRVMAGALVAVSASSGLTVFMHAPWQLDLLWGVVNGLATGAVSVPLAAIIANRWFVERRGLVTGLLTASNATGLGRDRAADGRAHRGDVRPRACRGRLRLGLLRAPARRGGGAWGAGAMRGWFGDYGWAFGTAGLLCLFASGLMAQISRAEPVPAAA